MTMMSSTLPAGYTPKILIHATAASFSRCNNNVVVPQNTSTYTITTYNKDDSSVMDSLKPLNLKSDMTRAHLSNLETFLKKSYSSNSSKEDPSSRRSKRNGWMEFGLNMAKLCLLQGGAEEEFDQFSEVEHLQSGLLSDSPPENSPRKYIGDRWREFHGCNEWTGLLDPLDEDLRREVVRYGEFIQAAYQSFFFSSSSSHPAGEEKCHTPAFPDNSFKVTQTLYATSSIGFPGWVEDMAPELVPVTQRTNRIGFVAVCEDDQEVRRMGRRDIVIALRGTCTCLEWAENLRDSLVLLDTGPQNVEGSCQSHRPKVQRGFSSLFTTSTVNKPSLSESVVREVRRVMELYKGESLSITVTGHSLGAALAILIADELSNAIENLPPIAVLSFGGPRVGNRGFTNRIIARNLKILRVVNCQDVITRVPGMFFVSEELDHKLREMIPRPALNFLDDNTPWAYSHVGTELRIDSRMSPYLKPDADAVCCHDMEAYLHLVDGFIASNCPFRKNAKRSLAKLVEEHRSNMKKLCLRRSKSFRVEEEFNL